MIRAFVAIPLPASQVGELYRLQQQLRKMDLDASFPAVDGLHLTLKFLGDVEPSRVEEIASALGRGAEDFSPFSLVLQGVGAFPRPSDPRVAWAGVDGGPTLTGLQATLDRTLAGVGFPRDERRFHPHLTLARIKSRRNVARLIRWLETEAPEPVPFTADVIHLYQSTLLPQGARYQVLETVRL